MEDKKLDNAIKYLTKDYEESDTTSAFMLCTRWALGYALELLKKYQEKQEGLLPVWQDRTQELVCQKCGGIVWQEDNYCSKCGQAVKWE